MGTIPTLVGAGLVVIGAGLGLGKIVYPPTKSPPLM